MAQLVIIEGSGPLVLAAQNSKAVLETFLFHFLAESQE